MFYTEEVMIFSEYPHKTEEKLIPISWIAAVFPVRLCTAFSAINL